MMWWNRWSTGPVAVPPAYGTNKNWRKKSVVIKNSPADLKAFLMEAYYVNMPLFNEKAFCYHLLDFFPWLLSHQPYFKDWYYATYSMLQNKKSWWLKGFLLRTPTTMYSNHQDKAESKSAGVLPAILSGNIQSNCRDSGWLELSADLINQVSCSASLATGQDSYNWSWGGQI